MGNSPRIASIHILDNDSLLNIFYLYRPFFLGEDENNYSIYRFRGGRVRWDQGRWWYRLAHVCQRWRNLILGSASYLGLSLVCTKGTPVENMLEHSPPLPITVDYNSENSITAEDEKAILLAQLLSSSVVASATSAFASLYRICGSLSWHSTGNFQSWNTWSSFL